MPLGFIIYLFCRQNSRLLVGYYIKSLFLLSIYNNTTLSVNYFSG